MLKLFLAGKLATAGTPPALPGVADTTPPPLLVQSTLKPTVTPEELPVPTTDVLTEETVVFDPVTVGATVSVKLRSVKVEPLRTDEPVPLRISNSAPVDEITPSSSFP